MAAVVHKARGAGTSGSGGQAGNGGVRNNEGGFVDDVRRPGKPPEVPAGQGQLPEVPAGQGQLPEVPAPLATPSAVPPGYRRLAFAWAAAMTLPGLLVAEVGWEGGDAEAQSEWVMTVAGTLIGRDLPGIVSYPLIVASLVAAVAIPFVVRGMRAKDAPKPSVPPGGLPASSRGSGPTATLLRPDAVRGGRATSG